VVSQRQKRVDAATLTGSVVVFLVPKERQRLCGSDCQRTDFTQRKKGIVFCVTPDAPYREDGVVIGEQFRIK